MNHIEQYSQAYMCRTLKVDIDVPAQQVWPLLFEFEKWNQTFERIDVISGSREQVGSVHRLVKQQGEWFMPPYLVKIVHIEPERRVVWKMFPEQGEGFFAFVEFAIFPVGSRTQFQYHVYTEALLPRMSPNELAAAEKKMAHDYERLEKHIFPILKRVAEGG